MPNTPVSIAIDGPAGAGKSSVARRLAAELGFVYIDTGAMYRAVTLACLRRGVVHEPLDPAAVEAVLEELELTLGSRGEVWLNGEEVSAAVRNEAVTSKVSAVAALACVRRKMVELQRRIERGLRGGLRGVVMDGRDIGSHVLPHAEHRFYLDASLPERARRRRAQCSDDAELADLPLEAWIERIERRDRRDSQRALAPLKIADGAVVVDTTSMEELAVVRALLDAVRGRSETSAP